MRPLKRWGAGLAIVLLGGCGQAAAPPVVSSPTASATSAQTRTLVAMGDSLTEGLGVEPERAYPAQLEARLRKDGFDWTVINAGASGETSSGALSRLDWVLKLQPDAVLLETGGNDGLRGIDPKVTKKNLAALVDELRKRDVPVMLAGMKTLSNLGPDYTRAFEASFSDVAKAKNVPLIPFFLEGVGGVAKLNQEDRIHPTEEGYTVIVKAIAPPVEKWLEGLPRKAVKPSSEGATR